MFLIDVGRYSAEGKGFAALIEAPAGAAGWAGPYLDDEVLPTDPWGAPCFYSSTEDDLRVRVYSLGRDGTEGCARENADIGRPARPQEHGPGAGRTAFTVRTGQGPALRSSQSGGDAERHHEHGKHLFLRRVDAHRGVDQPTSGFRIAHERKSARESVCRRCKPRQHNPLTAFEQQLIRERCPRAARK